MMRRLVAALALTALVACSSNPKPQPPTPPTPTPPPPPASQIPDVGTPVGPERLLRNHQNQYFTIGENGQRFDRFGCISCCMPWAKVPNTFWPNSGEDFQKECDKYGANFFHFRIGPWSAIRGVEDEDLWDEVGGPYLPDSLEFNPAYWDRVRLQNWSAYLREDYTEVVPVDDWWLKGACGRDGACEKKVPWPQEDVSAWGKVPSPQAERLIRKTVSMLGCFGNLVWATGNEEDLIPGLRAEHVQWRIDVIRDEEQKSGCGFVHMIGTGSWKPGISADYQISHERSPVAGPCNGRLCVNNEHNPEFPPAQEASLFKTARDAGQAWDAWRAEAPDQQWEARLQLFSEIVGGPGVPPPQVGCYPPADDPNLWAIVDGPQGNGSRKPDVQAAQAQVGNLCKEPKAYQNGEVAIAALNEQLRKNGLCAGGVGATDHAMTLETDGKTWGEYHAVAPFDTGCWSTRNIDYPIKFWKYLGQWTPPTQPELPPSSACVNPPAHPVDNCSIKEHTKGPNWTVVDSTFKVHDAAYCALIGFTDGRIECPVRPEGDPMREACEAEVIGTPVYTTTIPGAQPDPSGNPYLFRVPRGQGGPVTVHASKNPPVSCTVEVTP